MPEFCAHASLTSPDQTGQLARDLGQNLMPGDVLLLSGGVGAGKTHFARCLIQSLRMTPEDVPSPTFTLVQTYVTDAGEIWHTDLYRLSDVTEIDELGLLDAFRTAICLVEWPDRLAGQTPRNALSLLFDYGDQEDTRHLTLSWSAPDWGRKLKGVAHVQS